MYKQGNIVLVPIPFSDLSNQKQRPVLIISSNRYNQVSHNIIVVAITSRIRNLDYAVKIQTEDLVEGDLRFTSEIRTDKIYTLSKEIVRKKFGEVKSEILEMVREKVNDLIK